MEKQHLIQLIIHQAMEKFILYWLPREHCFTFGVPRGVIGAAELSTELNLATQAARNLGLIQNGHARYFNLKTLELYQSDSETMEVKTRDFFSASPAPVKPIAGPGPSWVANDRKAGEAPYGV